MVEVSDYPLRFRSLSFQKADGPYDSKCGALKEYSDFHKTLQQM